MAGFPGAGGSIDEADTLQAAATPGWLQRTTIGEPDGSSSQRVKDLADVFTRAGFKTEMSKRMADWQLTHASLVVPLARAARADDHRTADQLSRDRALMNKTAQEFKGNLDRMRRMGRRPTPWEYGAASKLPLPAVVMGVVATFRSPIADRFIVAHARRAGAEMELLESDLNRILDATS